MSSFEELKLQVPGKIVPLWFSTGGATHTGPERASGVAREVGEEVAMLVDLLGVLGREGEKICWLPS
jgi:hypothetical protein